MSEEKFKNTTTEVLIGLFQDPNGDHEIKDKVFLALMFRFREELITKCEFLCSRRGYDRDVARIITENTFIKYEKSRNWKLGECKTKSPDECFKFYLFRIANNELNDYYHYKQKEEKGLLYDGTEKVITQLPEIDAASLRPIDKLRHETIQSMSHKHQAIYLTYLVYQKDGVKMPRKLLKELRDHCGGIDQRTVQTYKKEINDKIEEAIRIAVFINQTSHE